jgi:hypothetical protein
MQPEEAYTFAEALAANYTPKDFLHLGHHDPLGRFVILLTEIQKQYPDVEDYQIHATWGQRLLFELWYNEGIFPQRAYALTTWKL